MSAEGLPGPLAPEPAAPTPAVEPELTRWQKIRLVIKVIELRVRFIALMAITGLVFGYWDTIWNHYEKWTRPAGERAAAAASDVEYFCPMHPNVVRGEAGNCPICGMPLSKRKKGEKDVLPAGVTARVALAPMRVQQAGVQTSQVSYSPLAETITTVGDVRFDERRLARISSKTKGQARVEKLLVNFTGIAVKAGEPLAELYSPELYQAVRELLLAQKNAAGRVQYQSTATRTLLGDGTDLVQLAREKLGLWGLTPEQLEQILATGRADYRLPILSPITGVVIRKNVVEGQYVAEGESLFEVADLSRVWVQAQVFEDQIGKVKVGQAVEARVQAFPGEVFRGTVAFIDPALDPRTRTVNVRYDLDNADGRLRPGMYATVILRTPVSEMPAFRERFAHRPATGPARVQRASFTTPAEQKLCPVTGSELGSMGDPLPVKLASGQVWICCEGCQSPLEEQPGKYLPKLARVEWTVEEQGICPVTRAKLGSMGEPLAVEVANQKVWVCCGGCPEKLKAQPDRYLAALAPAPKDAVLTVPESAVIDTGTKKIVYIESEPGTFEGREVVLGPRSGELFPVLEGLAPGDRVATAGSFLIDAESRLNPGAAATNVGSAGPTPRDAAPAPSGAASGSGHQH
jgi:Cu(I)/Ag(I) efflux system membrane fusion protein